MHLNTAKNKTNKIKTLLLIVGVIIAIIVTFYADVLGGQESSFYQHLVAPVNNPVAENTISSTSESSGYNSATKLFEIFTRNLPFLNHK